METMSPRVAQPAEVQRAGLLAHDHDVILELITRNEPLGETLARLAELVERRRPDLDCAVLVVRDGRLVHAAAPSLPERYVQALDGLPVGPTATALGSAAYRGEPILSTDLATDPLWSDRRDLALEHGLRTCWALPIRAGDRRVLGVLALYARRPSRPSQADLQLLETAVRLAALAIDHARLFDEAAMVEGLRSLTRLKSEFLSTVSHELRTPLSLIFGYAELLTVRAPRLSAEQVIDMATEIHTNSGTMIRLVDDLLDFARIEQGRLRLDLRRVDVSELLGGLFETFRLQPGGKRLRAELPPGLEASVDPERLSQVVGNLITNALRYAPDGPITLRAARHKGWLRIEVVDEGPGIPPEEQPRVWEKFYRGALAINTTPRGSGLGLAVVKHLVELQGGRVGLKSEVGRGSTFWFTLPVDG